MVAQAAVVHSSIMLLHNYMNDMRCLDETQDRNKINIMQSFASRKK